MKEKLLIWSKIAIVVIGWALTPVVGEYLIDKESQLSPLQLSFFRYFIAAFALAIILVTQKKFDFPKITETVKQKWIVFGIAAIVAAAMPIFLFFSVKWTTASSASFLLNFNVVLIPIFAYLMIEEKLKLGQTIGIGIATLGCFLVIFEKEIFNFLQFDWKILLGNFLAFTSGICWALYTVILKKYFTQLEPLSITLINLLIGSVLIAPFAFLVFPHTIQINLLGWGLILLIAIISTSLAYSFWLSLLNDMKAGETGVIQVMVPIFSVIISVWLLDETISYIFLIGAGLIAVGIFFVERNTEI